jgi:hypothetical protein
MVEEARSTGVVDGEGRGLRARSGEGGGPPPSDHGVMPCSFWDLGGELEREKGLRLMTRARAVVTNGG